MHCTYVRRNERTMLLETTLHMKPKGSSVVLLVLNTLQTLLWKSTQYFTRSPLLRVSSSLMHSSKVCPLRTSLRRYSGSTFKVTSVITPHIPMLTWRALNLSSLLSTVITYTPFITCITMHAYAYHDIRHSKRLIISIYLLSR